jgi:NADPH-dependent glutamate synthase beta subunit-like oxidoreductase
LFDYLKEKLRERQCEGIEELRNYIDGYDGAGAKVAIIGSGPAGLACAHDLALMGFRPTIFEMEPVAAGMLYVGVPEYRLPRDLIRAEVGVVESLGVDIRCNTCVGKDVTLDQLLADHQAVVLAVGAKKSRALPVPGAEGPGVLAGIDFLRDVAIGRQVTLGHRIVVIGGGNVSYDVARSAWRKKGEEIEPNPARFVSEDVSRVAIHEADHAEVHLCCLESREQMLADDIEVEEAEEEGVVRHNGIGPQEVLRDADGRITGVRFSKVTRLFDEEGRFSPTFDHEQSETIECDTVLVSIGQMCDLGFLGEQHGVELNERNYPAHDPETFMTTADGIFVAGDLQTGPRLIIDAVASGKKCARGIYRHLTGKAVDVDSQQRHFELEDYSREIGYESVSRSEIATLHP